MATVVLNLYTKAYPTITNRIKASVLSASSPYAIVVSEIDSVAGHPARTWNFPGLPRNNYGFSLDEINGAGVVVNNLALFSVVPGEVDGLLSRNDEQIQVDVTIGLVSGTTSFTFDGTAGKPDYIGWEIVPSELTGRGILVRGVDYSWDKVIGKFDLLILDDKFNPGAWFNIHFEPVQNPMGNSYPTVTDFPIFFVDSNTILDDTYFGGMLIIEPLGIYTEITLPDIATIVEGRKMMVNTRGVDAASVKFITQGADTINFLNGNLIAMLNESFSIYVFNHPVNGREYRVSDIDGNFKTVGQSVGDDSVQADVFNRKLLDGSSLFVNQYLRLYNEFVLKLPVNQVVDYDSHATGNNKYLWSLANSTNPSNNGKFLIPNRKNLFERNNSAGKAGDFQLEMIKATGLTIRIPLKQHVGSSASFGVTDGPPGIPPEVDVPITLGTGTETRPNSYLINKYTLI